MKCIYILMTITMAAWFLSATPAVALDLSREPIQPISPPHSIDPQKAALGKSLFFDRRLSVDHSISCAHCHELESKGGADGLKRSFGVDGREGLVNSPTVFNAALNFSQFWDGRAATLEQQAKGPITSHLEMANNWPQILQQLSSDQSMMQAFNNAYTDGITAANITNAIATFERTLITPDSRFDHYLKGDESAITTEEKKGYALFKTYGCVACHQGRNVGGNLYQTPGVMNDYFKDFPSTGKADLGRFNVTGDKADRHRFKVPSLRMAVLTAPYFHDGSQATLSETIRTMAKYQLGRKIPTADINAIIRFLYTLPGRWQGKALEPQYQHELDAATLSEAAKVDPL
ncbi:MAG: cytochrome-c peroxidase [Mariprofundus sp.]|nr:cytochrome-c peroxidase [Mariprofundus sp.]